MFSTKEEYDKLLEEAKKYPHINLLYDGSCAHFTGQLTRFALSMSPYLEEFYNIHMIKPNEKPDIIWVSSDKFRIELLDHGVPIMVEDTYQPPDILGETREILQHDFVKLLLKNSSAIDYSAHNDCLYNHSIHQTMIAKSCMTELIRPHLPKLDHIHPPLSEESFAKITPGWNYIVWPNFRHGFANDHKSLRDYYYDFPIPRYPELYDVPKSGTFLINERPYDVNFVGNIHDWHISVPLIKYHRKIAWEAIKKCPGNNYLRSNNCLGWHEYWKTLRQSKIVISPWGWEPVTIRDIEAILAGCVLIKPDTSFIRTYPNLPYFRCKRNFSDLSEQVTMILDKWDTMHDFREQACQQLHDASDLMPERVYSMLAKTIGRT